MNKKERQQYLDLLEAQKEKISILQNKLLEKPKYTYIEPIVNGSPDHEVYLLKVGELNSNSYLQYYFSTLHHEIVDRFTTGENSSDFCKGQLALLKKILNDSNLALSQVFEMSKNAKI